MSLRTPDHNTTNFDQKSVHDSFLFKAALRLAVLGFLLSCSPIVIIQGWSALTKPNLEETEPRIIMDSNLSQMGNETTELALGDTKTGIVTTYQVLRESVRQSGSLLLRGSVDQQNKTYFAVNRNKVEAWTVDPTIEHFAKPITFTISIDQEYIKWIDLQKSESGYRLLVVNEASGGQFVLTQIDQADTVSTWHFQTPTTTDENRGVTVDAAFSIQGTPHLVLRATVDNETVLFEAKPGETPQRIFEPEANSPYTVVLTPLEPEGVAIFHSTRGIVWLQNGQQLNYEIEPIENQQNYSIHTFKLSSSGENLIAFNSSSDVIATWQLNKDTHTYETLGTSQTNAELAAIVDSAKKNGEVPFRTTFSKNDENVVTVCQESRENIDTDSEAEIVTSCRKFVLSPQN